MIIFNHNFQKGFINMKKSTFLFLIFVSMADFTFGQTRKMFYCGHDEDPSYSQVEICKKLSENSFSSDEEAKEVVDAIVDAVGLSGNFTVMECGNISNAVAVNFEDKKGGLIRYILYDNSFLESIGNKSGDKYWSSTAILAHEVGHHLLGHTLNENGNNRPDKEIQADEFSGFVLGKLGATLKQAQSAIKQLRSENGSLTHPAKKLRLAAVKKGWQKAKAESLTISVSYASSYPYGICFMVNDKKTCFNPNETLTLKEIDSDGETLSLWECPTNETCKWTNFTVYPGKSYKIVDSGNGRGLKLVEN